MQRDVPRHFTAYTITFLVYFAVIWTIFYTQTHTFISPKDTKEKVLEMSLSTFVPEVVTPLKEKVIEPVVEVQEPIEEPVVEPVVKKPIVKPIVKEPILKKPVLNPVKKKVTKKPKAKKTKVKKPKVKKKVVKKIKKKSMVRKVKKKASQRETSSKQTKHSAGERNAFFNTLRKKIDRHKFYPRIAKKRRMEGSVKVKFTILSNGKVGNITVTGSKVFHKSAKNAVKSAFPIKSKNIPISLPKTVNLTLHYQIR